MAVGLDLVEEARQAAVPEPNQAQFPQQAQVPNSQPNQMGQPRQPQQPQNSSRQASNPLQHAVINMPYINQRGHRHHTSRFPSQVNIRQPIQVDVSGRQPYIPSAFLEVLLVLLLVFLFLGFLVFAYFVLVPEFNQKSAQGYHQSNQKLSQGSHVNQTQEPQQANEKLDQIQGPEQLNQRRPSASRRLNKKPGQPC